jgi:hypothetical protein
MRVFMRLEHAFTWSNHPFISSISQSITCWSQIVVLNPGETEADGNETADSLLVDLVSSFSLSSEVQVDSELVSVAALENGIINLIK